MSTVFDPLAHPRKDGGRIALAHRPAFGLTFEPGDCAPVRGARRVLDLLSQHLPGAIIDLADAEHGESGAMSARATWPGPHGREHTLILTLNAHGEPTQMFTHTSWATAPEAAHTRGNTTRNQNLTGACELEWHLAGLVSAMNQQAARQRRLDEAINDPQDQGSSVVNARVEGHLVYLTGAHTGGLFSTCFDLNQPYPFAPAVGSIPGQERLVAPSDAVSVLHRMNQTLQEALGADWDARDRQAEDPLRGVLQDLSFTTGE